MSCRNSETFSYVAEKDGKRLEADLTCLKKPSTWREKGTNVIHAECKSFNKFEHKDIERMKGLAAAFPGATLVFATLNNALQNSEVKLIRKLALSERRKSLHRKVSSQVILLTGTELFSRSIGEAWKGKGGLYDRFSQRDFELTQIDVLADGTQQLYLDLPAWSEWWDLEWKKRRAKLTIRKTGKSEKGVETCGSDAQ